jgi:hypothetical protein
VVSRRKRWCIVHPYLVLRVSLVGLDKMIESEEYIIILEPRIVVV